MIYNKEIDNGKEKAFQTASNKRSDYRSYLAEGNEQETGDQGSPSTQDSTGVVHRSYYSIRWGGWLMPNNVTFNIKETPEGEFVLILHNHGIELVSEQHRSRNIDKIVDVLKKKKMD
jgi:hypothetical protein